MDLAPDFTSILEKCQHDSYRYFAYVKEVGWIEFTFAKLIAPNRIRLDNAHIWNNKNIDIGLAAKERGIELAISDITLLLDSTS